MLQQNFDFFCELSRVLPTPPKPPFCKGDLIILQQNFDFL